MGLIKINTSYEGVRLETELEKMTTQKIPIKATTPMYYTERKDGVKPETDIRTDRWEIAQNAMGGISRAKIAKRETPGEPTQGTESVTKTE